MSWAAPGQRPSVALLFKLVVCDRELMRAIMRSSFAFASKNLRNLGEEKAPG